MIAAPRDGIVEIRATCTIDSDCIGVIIFSSRCADGRADLRIPAGETKLVPVGVSRRGRVLHRHDARDDPKAGSSYASKRRGPTTRGGDRHAQPLT